MIYPPPQVIFALLFLSTAVVLIGILNTILSEKIKTGYKNNRYKNSIGIIKTILKSNQIIGGKSDDQPRIGDCILVDFINLSWS